MASRANEQRYEGVEVRHRSGCATAAGGECSCRPSYRASVWDPRDRRLIRRSFPTLAAAKGWRIDASAAIRRGELRADRGVTLREAATAWQLGVASGAIRNRSGDRYKPSVVRSYELALRLRLLPELGGVRLGDLRRGDVQRLVDRLLADGCSPSTIRNTLLPLRVICRRALARGEIIANPTIGLELPAVRGRRDRIAAPREAAALIAALTSDQALWSTAFYAGLRLGELQALRWEDLDLDRGRIDVRRSWDVKEGPIEPKSQAGRRVVPVASVLQAALVEHRRTCAHVEGLVFGRSASIAFAAKSVTERAHRTWSRAGLALIGLHECRHSFASFMIAAGVNAKALSTYMGHASVTITFDRYGHLMPGNEQEAAKLLDDYLAAETAEATA
jgi:integrase